MLRSSLTDLRPFLPTPLAIGLADWPARRKVDAIIAQGREACAEREHFLNPDFQKEPDMADSLKNRVGRVIAGDRTHRPHRESSARRDHAAIDSRG